MVMFLDKACWAGAEGTDEYLVYLFIYARIGLTYSIVYK